MSVTTKAVAAAVEEQQTAAGEIARSVQQASHRVHDVSDGVAVATVATRSGVDGVTGVWEQMDEMSRALKATMDALIGRSRAASSIRRWSRRYTSALMHGLSRDVMAGHLFQYSAAKFRRLGGRHDKPREPVSALVLNARSYTSRQYR